MPSTSCHHTLPCIVATSAFSLVYLIILPCFAVNHVPHLAYTLYMPGSYPAWLWLSPRHHPSWYGVSVHVPRCKRSQEFMIWPFHACARQSKRMTCWSCERAVPQAPLRCRSQKLYGGRQHAWLMKCTTAWSVTWPWTWHSTFSTIPI